MWSHYGVNTEQLGRWRCLSSSMSTSSFVHLWISMKAVIHKGRKRPRVSGYQDLTSSTRVWRLLVIHKDKGKGAKVKLMSMGLIPRISCILMEAYPKLLVSKQSVYLHYKAAMHNAAFTKPHGMFQPWWVRDQQQLSRLPLEAQMQSGKAHPCSCTWASENTQDGVNSSGALSPKCKPEIVDHTLQKRNTSG